MVVRHIARKLVQTETIFFLVKLILLMLDNNVLFFFVKKKRVQCEIVNSFTLKSEVLLWNFKK